MNSALYLAQRVTAFILALAVTVHLATILYAAQKGLTAGNILARTRGDVPFLALYAIFVVAAAVHAPIGLRAVLREWLGWRGKPVDLCLVAFAAILFLLGLRAAYAVYAA